MRERVRATCAGVAGASGCPQTTLDEPLDRIAYLAMLDCPREELWLVRAQGLKPRQRLVALIWINVAGRVISPIGVDAAKTIRMYSYALYRPGPSLAKVYILSTLYQQALFGERAIGRYQ